MDPEIKKALLESDLEKIINYRIYQVKLDNILCIKVIERFSFLSKSPILDFFLNILTKNKYYLLIHLVDCDYLKIFIHNDQKNKLDPHLKIINQYLLDKRLNNIK